MDGEEVWGGLAGGIKVGAVIHKEFKVRFECFLKQFLGAFHYFNVILLNCCTESVGKE